MDYIELVHESFDGEHGAIDDVHLKYVLESTTPAKVAYYLAYGNMEFGTELLDELLKYRELGRI